MGCLVKQQLLNIISLQIRGPHDSGDTSFLLGNLVELSSKSLLATSTPSETGLFAKCASELLAHLREQQMKLLDMVGFSLIVMRRNTTACTSGHEQVVKGV